VAEVRGPRGRKFHGLDLWARPQPDSVVVGRLKASLISQSRKVLPFRYDVELLGQVRGSSVSPSELVGHGTRDLPLRGRVLGENTREDLSPRGVS